MPETSRTPRTGCSFCPPYAVRPATTVVSYRVPDPRSRAQRTDDVETDAPVSLLVCPDPRCIDLAEDQAVYDGAPEELIDHYALTPSVALALLGPVLADATGVA